MAYDLPARVTGMPIDADTAVAHLEAVGCAVDPARGRGVTPSSPSWRPDLTDPFDLVEEVARVVGYTHVPSVLPHAGAGRGLTREQRLRRRVGRTLAGAGCVEVLSFPFVGDAALDALGLPADDVLRRTVRLANPISSEEPAYTTTLLPGLLRTTARNLGRGAPGVALFETGTVAFPSGRGPAPIYGVDWRPSDDELAKLLDGAARAAAAPGRRAVRRARALRLVGRGSRRRLVRRDRRRTPARRRAGRRADRRRHRADALAPRPVRAAVGGGAGARPRRRAAPAGLPGLRPAAAHLGRCEIDLDLLLRRAPDVVPGAGVLDLPGGQGGRRAGRGRRGAAPSTSRTPCGRAPASCWRACGSSTCYTGEQVGAGRKSLAFALRFRAPDRTLTEQETGAARDAAVALAAERLGAVQR